MQIKLLLPSGWVELIRVYNSSKRGIFLDLSLIQSSKKLNILDDLYELSYSDYLKATLLTIPSRKQLLKKSSPKRRSKEKKKNEKQKKVKLRNEIEESKAQKPFWEKVALNIIEYTKKNGISVMRYDSKISESIYLKFDYGMAGSLRISAHNSKKTELQYTFNIIKGLDKPCVKTGKTSSGKECQMYFYPFELAKNVAYDIVRYKNYRVCKYGDLSYENCMYKHKSLVGVRSGFWSKAIEV